MSYKTALQLISSACYRSNIPAPTALVGSTSTSDLQLLHLFYEAGESLLRAGAWAQLKKSYTVNLVAGRSFYHLPLDFYAALPMTHWDRANSWPAGGPVGDAAFDYSLYGLGTGATKREYRVFGLDLNPNSSRGQFQVTPTPEAGDQGLRITFEYVSKSWLRPPLWVAGATVGATAYCSCSGNNYSHASGTTVGTVPPNMAYGEGQDGSVFWKWISVSAWLTATAYAPGDYRTNGGNLYVCTVAGISSGGPTGTTEETDITDGGATWRYLPTNSWTGSTAFEFGDILKISSTYWRCTQGGITNTTTQPGWDNTTVSDGLLTWTHYAAAYDSLISDSDLCMFDDELMSMELRWRFLRARGLQYQDLLDECERAKAKAAGRWNEGQILDLAGVESMDWPTIPEGNWGQ